MVSRIRSRKAHRRPKKARAITQRVLQDMAEELRKQKVLNQIIASGSTSVYLTAFLEQVLSCAIQATHFAGGAIFLTNPVKQTAQIVCCEGLPAAFIESVRTVSLHEAPFRDVLVKGKCIFTQSFSQIQPSRTKIWKYRSCAGIPLRTPGGIVGALSLLSKAKYQFSQEDKELLKAISLETGNAIARMQAEQALLQSEARYRTVVEQQTDLICRFLPGGILTFANDACCRYFGKTRDELIGQSFLDSLLEPDRLNVERAIASLNRDNPMETHEQRVMTPDGMIRWQQWTNLALFDSSGHIVECQGVGRDITERRAAEEQLQEKERFLESVFSSIQDGISILDSDMRIVRVNAVMEKWYAHATPLVGKKCYEAYHGRTERCDVCPTHRALVTGKAAYDVVAKTGAGGVVVGWLDLFAFPLISVTTGKMTGIIEYVRDITERKKAEQELEGHRQHLEKLVEERTRQLMQSERLASAGRLAGSVAHEINNPLQGIMTNLAVIRDSLPRGFRETESLDCVMDNVARIRDIVRQLLDVYRGSGTIRSLVDLNVLIRKVASLVKNQFRLKGVHFETVLDKALPRIQAQSDQLHQVILNLVLNALDHTEAGGQVQVVSVADKERIRVEVRDTGRGIPKEDLGKIFDPFFSTKQGTGAGLGLFVCQGLVGNHNGTIEVQSEPGKGSMFLVSLPVAPA